MIEEGAIHGSGAATKIRVSCYTDAVRNVTIALDDETARWARIEAARQDTSMSRLVGGLLREQMARAGREADRYEQARRSYLARRPSSAERREGVPLP